MSLATLTRMRRVRLAELSAVELEDILRRATTDTPELRERVRAIIADVRAGGDAALREASARFGGGMPAVGRVADTAVDPGPRAA